MPAPPRGLLHDRLALITGAASGIGQAIALAYAQAGARVVITDRDASACSDTLAQVQALGGQGWVFALDVTDNEAVVRLAAQVQAQVGAVSILVNNAGVILREGLDSPQAHAAVRQVMDVNVLGVFNVMHAFLPALRATRGTVVNISSGASFHGQPNAVGYSASKAAVRLLSQSMVADLAASGIRVNVIAPGVIETPMTAATRANPERLQRFMARIPAGRLGFPMEVAQAAVFLASDMASYINGVTLPVDGGYLAV
ncbi:glucose 1-dehydrogenase [Curvibacter sp. CHRR-16]|uniref:SDR family NAD(P)-dependent oxidoreductase n=1 Tax=Curvibacter sp. CHRR-16 TaxID=2835872 RepID=UPI001BD97995|nr:glucose 1-dehydrogenase [Curvibacter sp. CHRR-16]MBT0571073.1 glucose 1-dehydrogenase [Curvibacter sp. CHRR-16]